MIIKTIYTLLIGVLLTLPIYADSSSNEYGPTVINLAGKQRMLTQKMSKEALLIIKGIAIEKNKENLKNTIALFDKTLYALRDGSSELNLPKTNEKEIVEALNKEIKLWNLFRKFLDEIVEDKVNKNTLKAVEIVKLFIKIKNYS